MSGYEFSQGLIEGDTVYWYWIGRHEDYDRLV